MEIWKNIVGYEGKYQISNLGRVKSLKDRYGYRERILKPSTNKRGYKKVVLVKVGEKRKTFLVHRLVAEAFIPNPNNYSEVNHKDENPSNNNVDNLEWCTRKYNINYGTAIERATEKKKGYKHSEETKLKISKNHADLSGENHPFYGKHLSDETKNKISKKAKERFQNKENHPLYRKHHSEETKEKISKAHKRKHVGENSPVSRKVRCITTGEIFNTVTKASEKMKTHRSDINKCCRKIHKTAGKLADGTKLEWEYID